jgi:hypothetical protein
LGAGASPEDLRKILEERLEIEGILTVLNIRPQVERERGRVENVRSKK